MSPTVWSHLCHLSHIPDESSNNSRKPEPARSFIWMQKTARIPFWHGFLLSYFSCGWPPLAVSERALLPELVSHQSKQAFQPPSYRKLEKEKRTQKVKRFINPSLSVLLFRIMVTTEYPQKWPTKATLANSFHAFKKASGALSSNNYKFSGLLHLQPGSNLCYHSWK